MTAISHESVTQFLRDNLLGYATAQFPDFKPGRHHKLLASKLEDVEAGRLKRLCVTIAPRHGKSKLTSELFPSWYLGRNPDKRVLSLSYGQDLADVFGRSVRNYLKTPTFSTLFPGCQLAADSNSIKRFNVSAGGGYATIGVGGATTGRGADLMVIDDVIKDREQADSPVYRETLLDWYRSVARTRLQPGGAIVVVNTRWGTNDFISWLLSETAHEGWEVINLPAIALPNDPLGRQPGEALWPEQYGLEALEQIKQTLGNRDWNALYQQCPLADSDIIFSPNWLQFYDEAPTCDRLGTSAKSSWVVGQVWGVKDDGKYLLHQSREQRGFSDTLNAIRKLATLYPKGDILIENKANGPAVIETLQEEISRIKPVEPQGGKEDRAYAVVPMFERKEVWFPNPKLYPWVKSLLTELESFPMSSTDDCVDAMTQALVQLKTVVAAGCAFSTTPPWSSRYNATDSFGRSRWN
jgi:predicted phage terminase large subunit-like protein